MIKKEREVKSKRGGPFCKKKNKGRGPFRQRAPDKLAGPYGTFFLRKWKWRDFFFFDKNKI